MDTQGEKQPVKWLDKDPFPYQQVRNIIDIVGDCISNRGSIYRKINPVEKYIGSSEIPEADKSLVIEFIRGAFQRMDSLPQEVRDSYVGYWNIVWDVCGYDKVTGAVGSERPESGSNEEAALGVYRELNSPFTQELIIQGQKLLWGEKYSELFKHILDKELERAISSTYEAGLHLGYADGLILMSQTGQRE